MAFILDLNLPREFFAQIAPLEDFECLDDEELKPPPDPATMI